MIQPDNIRFRKLTLNNGTGAIPAAGFGTLMRIWSRPKMRPRPRWIDCHIPSLIPGVAALALLCSPIVRGQAVVREIPVVTSAPTEVTGTLAEWRSDSVIILGKDMAEPVRFSFAKKVEYVDAAGKRVGREVITPGVPVTMRYIREGDRMLVERIIVQRPLAAETKAAASSETGPKPASKLDSDYEMREIDVVRVSIDQEARLLSGHSR